MAYEKLTKSLVPASLLGDIDYEKVVAAMVGFMPAFVTEAIHNALRYTIARTHGHPSKVETSDIVDAALGLRRQHDLMNNAGEGANAPTVDSTMKDLVVKTVNGVQFGYDEDGNNNGLIYNSDRKVGKIE